jgi:hypothetical protein
MTISIFISTVSDEFRACRDQLVHDLTRQNVAVKVQEDFKDFGGDTLDTLDVASADGAVVFCISWATRAALPRTKCNGPYTFGLDSKLPLGVALPNSLRLAHTPWEAWLALYHSKSSLIAKPKSPSWRSAPARL